MARFYWNLSKHVNFKTDFSDNQRMDRCLNILERDAKRMVYSISQSGYASILNY